MKKLFTLIFCFALNANANYNEGKNIFEQKCSSCHTGYVEPNKLKDNFYNKNNTLLHLKAPTVNMLVYAILKSPKHIGDPSDPEMQKIEIEEFIKDYLNEPNIDDSICEQKFLQYYPKKPSMKGQISEDEISLIVDYFLNYKQMREKLHPMKKKNLKNLSTKELLKKAKLENKIILVEATSKHCYFCKKMDKEVFSLDDVKQALNKNFLFLKIDVEKNKLPLGLNKKYKKVTPTFFTLNSNGEFMHDYIGSWNKKDFLMILNENLDNK